MKSNVNLNICSDELDYYQEAIPNRNISCNKSKTLKQEVQVANKRNNILVFETDNYHTTLTLPTIFSY